MSCSPPPLPVSVIVDQMDQGMSSTELLAVPMFVLLGLLLEMSGIARVLVDLLSALVGHKRGGLSYVLIARDVSDLRHLRLQGG